MARLVRTPILGEEYTFRRYDKKFDKVVFNTYRFTGEVTKTGRFVFYEVTQGYFMDCTLAGWGYMLRKRFVRRKTVTGKVSKRVADLTAMEKAIIKDRDYKRVPTNTQITSFCLKVINEMQNYSPKLKEDIAYSTGVNVDNLIKTFKGVSKMNGIAQDRTWNSLMNKYIKVASHQGVAIANLI